MTEIARRIRVTGRVQGVFYRAWTQEQACEIGVRGWVRNRADGTVEAHVEGQESDIVELVERLEKGPPSAKVENVSVEAADVENAAGFEVRF